MPPSARSGSWHFQTLWTFPATIPSTNAITSAWLVGVDDALKRDLLERTTLPPLLRNAQLKYKISDLQLALGSSPITLPVTGYIQSLPHRAVDLDHLFRWFPATWSPVVGNLGRDKAYGTWFPGDPGYRHVQLYGEPAIGVAKRGTSGGGIKVRLPDDTDADFPICFTNICIRNPGISRQMRGRLAPAILRPRRRPRCYA